jgi:hypothetical protein
MSDTYEPLLSAGTSADSVTIQLLETLAVVGAASVLGLAIIEAIGLAIVAVMLALAALGGAYALRRDRVLRNEEAARDARAARYTFPMERTDTIQSITAPDDLKTAAIKTIVGGQHLSRLEITARLSARIGPTRAAEYLPLILQYADRDVEGDAIVR